MDGGLNMEKVKYFINRETQELVTEQEAIQQWFSYYVFAPECPYLVWTELFEEIVKVECNE